MNPERWCRIEELYHLVLELEPDQRGSYLDKACAGDILLRREVERLMGRQPKPEGFLEYPALEVAAKALAEDGEAQMDSSILGRSLSHYKILERIGAGGMGVVYRSRDEHLGRNVRKCQT